VVPGHGFDRHILIRGFEVSNGKEQLWIIVDYGAGLYSSREPSELLKWLWHDDSTAL